MKLDSMLYVEDDQDLRRMSRQFKRHVAEVVVADDENDALTKLGRSYDLIVLDGLEGQCFPLYEKIREGHPQTPVILYTSNSKVMKKAADAGLAYFEKPDNFCRVLEWLTKD